MKKGFTLIELLAVIVILGIISLLIVPSALELIETNKTKAYDRQIDRIFDATNRYASDYENPINWDSNRILVSVQQLIDGGYLEGPIIDQRTDENIPGTTQVEVIRSNEGKYTFRIFTPIPEACFTFGGNTIYGYDIGNPLCPDYVAIPNTLGGVVVNNINDWSFANLGITGVSFPSTITYIGTWAFANNLLTSVELPPSITVMKSYAFWDNQLTSIKIPNGVTLIENEVFNTNRLTSISIPTSVREIWTASFNNNLMANNKDAFIYARNGDGSEDRTTIVSYAGESDNVVVPEGVEKLLWWSLCGSGLETVVLPNTLKIIENYAMSTNNITSVNIPSSVNSILPGALNRNNLPDAEAFIYKRNADGSIDNTYVVSYGGAKRDSVVIPNGVITIGAAAFHDIGLTTNVTIPNTVRTIMPMAFNRNYFPTANAFIYARNGDGSINNTWVVSYAGGTRTTVTIPNNITRIGAQAFQYEYIENIVLPNALVTIEGYAFAVGSLTNITIPSTVTTIDDGAFADNDVSRVVMNRATTAIGNNMVSLSDNNFRTTYTAGGIGTYNRNTNGTWTKQ